MLEVQIIIYIGSLTHDNVVVQFLVQMIPTNRPILTNKCTLHSLQDNLDQSWELFLFESIVLETDFHSALKYLYLVQWIAIQNQTYTGIRMEVVWETLVGCR